MSEADGAGDAEATTTSAVVVVQRSADPSGGSHVEASARFVRVAATSSSDEALRAIGAAIDLPAPDSCATLASLAGGVGPEDPAPFVELLDVGPVSIQANGASTPLAARQLPDVTDVVSGVVYARAADPAVLPDDAPYVVHVGGTASLPGFDATALAPPAPSDVRVEGENAGSVLVARDASIELTWPARAAGADVIYVDVQPSAVRCVLQDDQDGADDAGRTHGSVPRSFLSDSGLLVIHRFHREPLRAAGLSGGEIRFDFARSLPYRRL